MPEGTGFIINPSSNAGKALEQWNSIRNILDKKNIGGEEFFTRGREDYGIVIPELIEKGITRIIIARGDGSLSEAAYVIMKLPENIRSSVSLGLIPLGSGNDWARSLGSRTDPDCATDIILKGRIRYQDVGKIEFAESGRVRYFVNVAGIGFDANTAKNVNEIKSRGKGGKLNYVKALAIEFFRSATYPIDIITDDQVRHERIFSLAAGIGQFNGNGIRQCPLADPFDGQMDITLIKEIGKLDFIMNIPRLRNGNFTRHKQVETFRTQNISLITDKEMLIEADGEICGQLPVRISIIPDALAVIVP
jgi:YegS/Rv2252/BmrU family lipid kinase